jgi:hypothetical protein
MRTNNTDNSLPAEFFIIQLDGHVRSSHGRFVEALSLQNEFSQHEVQVRATPAAVPHGDIKLRTGLH